MTVRDDSENVAVAFGVVIAAGAATAVGGAIVFFPTLIQYANRKALAAGLGLSAGVMVYVSFVEIFQKSVLAFKDAGFLYKQAYLSATFCFFAGVIGMICLNMLIHVIAMHNRQVKEWTDGNDASQKPDESNEEEEEETESGITASKQCSMRHCCGTDPEELKEMVKSIEEKGRNGDCTAEESSSGEGGDIETGGSKKAKKKKISFREKRKLVTMSLNTAVAIALHNFPEGLATFVATMNDPAVGATLAIAIAIHNIPEGMCVALPVFYATENRWRGFFWAVMSGLSEPLAALIGWSILSQYFSDMVYGVLFGIVGGMMVVISVKELLPTAHRYDPDDKITTNFFVFGMGIISISLVLFVQVT